MSVWDSIGNSLYFFISAFVFLNFLFVFSIAIDVFYKITKLDTLLTILDYLIKSIDVGLFVMFFFNLTLAVVLASQINVSKWFFGIALLIVLIELWIFKLLYDNVITNLFGLEVFKDVFTKMVLTQFLVKNLWTLTIVASVIILYALFVKPKDVIKI